MSAAQDAARRVDGLRCDGRHPPRAEARALPRCSRRVRRSRPRHRRAPQRAPRPRARGEVIGSSAAFVVVDHARAHAGPSDERRARDPKYLGHPRARGAFSVRRFVQICASCRTPARTRGEVAGENSNSSKPRNARTCICKMTPARTRGGAKSPVLDKTSLRDTRAHAGRAASSAKLRLRSFSKWKFARARGEGRRRFVQSCASCRTPALTRRGPPIDEA